MTSKLLQQFIEATTTKLESQMDIREEMIPIELVDTEEDDNLDDTSAEDKHEESDSNNSDHNVDHDSKSSHLDDDDDSSDSLSGKQGTRKRKALPTKPACKISRKQQQQLKLQHYRSQK